ncbi:MAG: DUF4160 domain-containing protein [Cyclobacteriaceae bacterium]|nr:DUF4160 domain-containing protein [Cyclobacteriaceae bacterium SS2]
MAELCRFYGIIIYMYGFDHNPPHFHFIYGDFECIMYLDGYIVEGKAPSKVIKKVEKWLESIMKNFFKPGTLLKGVKLYQKLILYD